MKRILGIIIPLIVVAALFVTGCSSNQSSRSSANVPSIMPAPPMTATPAPMPSFGTAEKGTAGSVSYSSDSIIAQDTDRKIVRTGNITLEVADIGKTMDDITQIANDLGGYVVSSNRQGNNENESGRVSVRVPSNHFDEALGKLRTLAVKVMQESTNSRDVTEEYTDLQAQLGNLQATEAQYLALLKKAEKVDEILSVQRELSNVRGQIDRIKGRMQYLDRTTEMSLIDIAIQQKASIDTKGWNPGQTVMSAINGLLVLGRFLVDLIIWLVALLPIWIIIMAVVFLVRYLVKRKKQPGTK